MTIDEKDLLNSMLNSLSDIDFIKPEDFPNIDLYMDQVTTFMEEQLATTKRHDEDKILTKTMINNYAKNNLLPPPVKKKYSKEHVLVMIFIYYFKNILSIKDIEILLSPITEKYFHNGRPFNITSIYEEVCGLEKSRIEALQKDVAKAYHQAMESFGDVEAEGEDTDYLKLFSFIASLSFDVYVKKLLIEKLINELPEPAHDKKKK